MGRGRQGRAGSSWGFLLSEGGDWKGKGLGEKWEVR